MRGRIISLLLSIIYLVISYSLAGGEYSLRLLLYLLLPLACIWFSKEMGSYTGSLNIPVISESSPGPVLKFMGWILLLLPLFLPFLAKLIV